MSEARQRALAEPLYNATAAGAAGARGAEHRFS
jgi:hypothetical protein